jgi:hypothetical protein
LHNEELHNLYASPNYQDDQIKENEMGGACNTHESERRNAYEIFVGKPEGKRPLGRPRRRWEDNIRMDLRVIGWEGVDCMHLAQDRNQWRAFVNTVTNLRVPLMVGKFLTS